MRALLGRLPTLNVSNISDLALCNVGVASSDLARFHTSMINSGSNALFSILPLQFT